MSEKQVALVEIIDRLKFLRDKLEYEIPRLESWNQSGKVLMLRDVNATIEKLLQWDKYELDRG